MHLFNVAVLFILLILVGVEFSVSAFVNPAAWRLGPEAQLQILSRLALVLGKVMPVWYAVSTLLLGAEIWLYRHSQERILLLTAGVVWICTVVASILFEVPRNNRVAEGASDWQRTHRVWDRVHRVRIAALTISAVLLLSVVVR